MYLSWGSVVHITFLFSQGPIILDRLYCGASDLPLRRKVLERNKEKKLRGFNDTKASQPPSLAQPTSNQMSSRVAFSSKESDSLAPLSSWTLPRLALPWRSWSGRRENRRKSERRKRRQPLRSSEYLPEEEEEGDFANDFSEMFLEVLLPEECVSHGKLRTWEKAVQVHLNAMLGSLNLSIPSFGPSSSLSHPHPSKSKSKGDAVMVHFEDECERFSRKRIKLSPPQNLPTLYGKDFPLANGLFLVKMAQNERPPPTIPTTTTMSPEEKAGAVKQSKRKAKLRAPEDRCYALDFFGYYKAFGGGKVKSPVFSIFSMPKYREELEQRYYQALGRAKLDRSHQHLENTVDETKGEEQVPEAEMHLANSSGMNILKALYASGSSAGGSGLVQPSLIKSQRQLSVLRNRFDEYVTFLKDPNQLDKFTFYWIGMKPITVLLRWLEPLQTVEPILSSLSSGSSPNPSPKAKAKAESQNGNEKPRKAKHQIIESVVEEPEIDLPTVSVIMQPLVDKYWKPLYRRMNGDVEDTDEKVKTEKEDELNIGRQPEKGKDGYAIHRSSKKKVDFRLRSRFTTTIKMYFGVSKRWERKSILLADQLSQKSGLRGAAPCHWTQPLTEQEKALHSKYGDVLTQEMLSQLVLMNANPTEHHRIEAAKKTLQAIQKGLRPY